MVMVIRVLKVAEEAKVVLLVSDVHAEGIRPSNVIPNIILMVPTWVRIRDFSLCQRVVKSQTKRVAVC